MQTRILIGGARTRTASVANAVSAFKVAGIFLLDQNAIPVHFNQFCAAVETGEATEPDVSVLSINNSPDHSSSTNSGALLHIRHSKPLTLSEIRPVHHVSVNNTTVKRRATLTSSEFIKNKQ
jgi:hypothetical protein